MRLASIDIGSNAVRLLIADVTLHPDGALKHFRKVKLFRVPVRLGMDAFTEKKISDQNIKKLTKAMEVYQGLMEIYEVEDYRANATSAMREAKNSEKVIQLIKTSTGIEIEVINGKQEADLILSNQSLLTENFDPRFSHLYVDVGGGSTEISLLTSKGVSHSRSFKIGTIRLFKNMVAEKTWKDMEQWLTSKIKPKLPLNIIGSGGNINRIFKRSNNRKFEPMMYDFIKKERDLLATLSIEDRIDLQDLNRDRAEVIVPALDVFLFVMETTGIRQVVVPKIGVADGIIRSMVRERKVEYDKV